MPILGNTYSLTCLKIWKIILWYHQKRLVWHNITIPAYFTTTDTNTCYYVVLISGWMGWNVLESNWLAYVHELITKNSMGFCLWKLKWLIILDRIVAVNKLPQPQAPLMKFKCIIIILIKVNTRNMKMLASVSTTVLSKKFLVELLFIILQI